MKPYVLLFGLMLAGCSPSRMGIQPILLFITDVLLSLQMGMVNTVYTSRQGALALQWFTILKHVTRLRVGYTTSGILIFKKKCDKLIPIL